MRLFLCIICRHDGMGHDDANHNEKKGKHTNNEMCCKHNLAYHGGAAGEWYLQEKWAHWSRQFACCLGQPVISFVMLRISDTKIQIKFLRSRMSVTFLCSIILYILLCLWIIYLGGVGAKIIRLSCQTIVCAGVKMRKNLDNSVTHLYYNYY